MEDVTTAPETGRNEDKEPIERFAPDNAWCAEFEKQLTSKLIDGLRNYARPRAFAVAAAGRKVDEYYARELVQDAIGDTWSGVLHWDPKRCSLELHLLRAIQSRSDKHRKHARANPHDAIGDRTDLGLAAETLASSECGSSDASEYVYSREAMAMIRAEAAVDKSVLRVLDAYDAGATTKDDVLAVTKMKARTYHNAHIRLKRIVRTLADHKLAHQARA